MYDSPANMIHHNITYVLILHLFPGVFVFFGEEPEKNTNVWPVCLELRLTQTQQRNFLHFLSLWQITPLLLDCELLKLHVWNRKEKLFLNIFLSNYGNAKIKCYSGAGNLSCWKMAIYIETFVSAFTVFHQMFFFLSMF